MKKPMICLAAILSLYACKKDDDGNTAPPETQTTARITVNNATLWATSKPYGALTAGATVSLYTTVASYPASPAYTATTDANGVASFDKVTPGEYYIVAEKEYLHEKLTNMPGYMSGVGGLVPDSVWQEAPASGTSPVPYNGSAGNFRYKDLNQDGVVNSNDISSFPATRVTINKGDALQQRVLIGEMDNRKFGVVPTSTELNTLLATNYIQFVSWRELNMALDAVYTDEYDCTSLASTWCTLNGYTQTASDDLVNTYWNNAFILIGSMGNIIANTEQSSTLSEAEKRLIYAQAKIIKAYTYMQLTNFFGPMPLQEYILLRPGTARATQTETWNFIVNLLTSALEDLQVAAPPTTNKALPGKDACNALLAKVYLQQKQYGQAATYASKVISTGNYSMQAGNGVFTSTTDKEIIWATGSTVTNATTKLTFTKGKFAPEIRYAEVMLIRAEASIAQGDVPNAEDYVNPVRSRAGSTLITGNDATTVYNGVRETWASEMKSEGQRFAQLARWDSGLATLGSLGFQHYNVYLPIPYSAMTWHPNIAQNAGY